MSQTQSGSRLGTPEQREQKYESMDVQQAQARVIASPSQMSYEAKFALQQVKEIAQEQGGDPAQVAEIIEPLARAVGWAEALSFAFTKITERDAVEHLAQSGLLSGSTR